MAEFGERRTHLEGGVWFKKHYPDLYAKLQNAQKRILSQPKRFQVSREVLFLFMFGDENICKQCGAPTAFDVLGRYRDNCSLSCGGVTGADKSKITTMAKRGVDHHMKDPAFMQEYQQVMFDRHGYASSLSDPRVRRKIRRTFLKKYGVANPQQCLEIAQRRVDTWYGRYGKGGPQYDARLEKYRKTCLANYGVEHPVHSAEVEARTKRTNLERYGHEWNIASKHSRRKQAKTNLKKYGVTNPAKSPDVIEKGRATKIERYGTELTGLRLKRKTVTDRFGKTHKVVGAEDVAIAVLQDMDGVQAIRSRKLPVLRYQFDGRLRRYYPDLGIVFSDTRHLVEVKSGWTLAYGWKQNLAKFRVANKFCRDRGFTFVLFVVEGGKTYSIANPTAKSIRSQLRFLKRYMQRAATSDFVSRVDR